MKAKKVYEFKRTRKQGLSKQTELGPRVLRQQKVDKWFNEYAPEYTLNGKYRILKDGTVIVYSRIKVKNIDWIPEYMRFEGLLEISDSNITELNNITTKHFLILENNLNLKRFNNVKLKNNLYIYNCPIEEINSDMLEGINLPSLHLAKCNIKELPKGINEYNSLEIKETLIEYLPEKLYVLNSLHLTKNEYLTELPKSLNVGNFCDLRNSKFTKIYKDTKIGGSLNIKNSNITEIEDGVQVNARIYIDKDQNIKIPDYLKPKIKYKF